MALRIGTLLLPFALFACDVSQKKPEVAPGSHLMDRGAMAAPAAGRSIRLYGPGIDRQKQTHI